jgi:predicted kinase
VNAEYSRIELPADAAVLLVGPAGSGKSTFATRHFPTDAVLSSDAYRERVAGNRADQSATEAAFRLIHAAADQRLARGLLTVIDATNVRHDARDAIVELADRYDRPLVAIVFDLSVEECLARNANRPSGQVVPPRAVRRQHRLFQRAVPHLAAEGFRVVRLRGVQEIAEARVTLGVGESQAGR